MSSSAHLDQAPSGQHQVTNLLVCAWCGPASIVLFVLGFVVLARFIPALPPGDGAESIAAIFRDRGAQIKLGLILVQVALGLWLPWGIALISRVRLIEGSKTATLANLQLGAIAVTITQLVIMTVLWELAAFRAGETVPWITQAFNDAGWFLLLFCFVPLTIWVFAMAVPVLQDATSAPTYPRWVGYLSLWVAVLLLPGPVLVYFKHGIFAWSGIIPFYIPLSAFFLWFAVTTYYTITALNLTRTTAPAI